MVQTHATDTYPLRVRSFLFQLHGILYLFHFLVTTTNVPNGPILNLWTPLVGHKTTELYPLGLQLCTS